MKLIGLAGKKQAGKNSAANFIAGQVLMDRDVIDTFLIDEITGALAIPTDENRFEEIDLLTRDPENRALFNQQIFPYVKVYSFSDPLKEFCHNVFGIEEHKLWGTNDQKNEETHLKWSDIPLFTSEELGLVRVDSSAPLFNVPNRTYMTGREVLQYFGTNVCRRMYGDCWVNATINRVIAENPEVAIICDVRFKNEVYGVNNAGGLVTYLARHPFEDSHESEKDLDDLPQTKYACYLDNSEMSMSETHEKIEELLSKWGVIS